MLKAAEQGHIGQGRVLLRTLTQPNRVNTDPQGCHALMERITTRKPRDSSKCTSMHGFTVNSVEFFYYKPVCEMGVYIRRPSTSSQGYQNIKIKKRKIRSLEGTQSMRPTRR